MRGCVVGGVSETPAESHDFANRQVGVSWDPVHEEVPPNSVFRAVQVVLASGRVDVGGAAKSHVWI